MAATTRRAVVSSGSMTSTDGRQDWPERLLISRPPRQHPTGQGPISPSDTRTAATSPPPRDSRTMGRAPAQVFQIDSGYRKRRSDGATKRQREEARKRARATREP